MTWQELLRRQFEADRVGGHSNLRWLPATHARRVWERLVRDDAGLAEILSPAGLGDVAYRSWNLLHQYCIPDTALDAAAGVEALAFAGWVASYRGWLQTGGWLDPAQAAGKAGAMPRDTPFEFRGFDRLTPEQSRFVDSQRAAGVAIALQPAADATEAIRGEVVACNDFDDEIETAARWAAARLQVQPDARVALVVPGLDVERSRVRRVLDRVLVPRAARTTGPAPESTAYELAAARPLLERPVVAAALGWLEALVRPAEPGMASTLLLGAYDGAAMQERDARAELDVALRRSRLPQPGLAQVAASARQHGCTATAARIDAALVRAARWTVPQLPSRWATEFSALLLDLGWPGVAPDSAENQSVQRWQTLVAEFAAGDDVTGPMRAGTALGQLRALATETAFEPQEIAAPLLVIDPATATGMHFDASWICGLDAARWPAPAAPDPFLPRDWQARQGVAGATAELAERDARLRLQQLTHSAPVVLCSVPRFEQEAPLLPSAFVAGLPVLERDALDVSLWRGVDTTRALFQSRPPMVRVVDGRVPPFAELDVAKGGARLLELQSACPFRAAVELRLGGRQLEDPAAGIAPTERGILVHDVLEAFWKQVQDQPTLLAMSSAQVEALVREFARGVVEPLRASADEVRGRLLDLEQRWLEARVLDLVERDRAREPFTVVQAEAEQHVDVGGVQVRVKLDRVDRLADGSLAVIDYKTGSGAKPAAWMGERPESPQLPLYVRVVGEEQVSAVAFGVVRKGATEYVGIARAGAAFGGLKPFVPT
jgi:probable DNA repair protein